MEGLGMLLIVVGIILAVTTWTGTRGTLLSFLFTGTAPKA